jgi:RNA polymerase sigma-70 factor (ECF subfamily)
MAMVRSESITLVNGSIDGALDFERLVEQTQRVVYRVAYSVLANNADAEDVTQEVFVQAYRKLDDLRDPDKFQSWVTRMSYRFALNRRRAQTRSQERETRWIEQDSAQPPDAEALAASRDNFARIQAGIERLPEKLRAVVAMCAIDGLQTRDVALVLGIPEGTVRSRLHAARKRLLETVKV